MKLTTLLLMAYLLTGCINNPLFKSKEEKAISSLEKELTEYATSLVGNKDVKSYLQTKYPEVYKSDAVEVLSFGSEPYNNRVFIVIEDGIKIKLTTPCIGLSCGAKKDDVILFTKNKEKIKDAIRQYIALANKPIDSAVEAAYNSTEKLKNNVAISFFIGVGEAMNTCSSNKEALELLVNNNNCIVLKYNASNYICCDKNLAEYLKKQTR